MKKIFVISCNPKKDSFRAEYLQAYIEEAKKAGNEVRFINIYGLEIDYLKFDGETPVTPLSNELKEAQDNLVWADQIVLSYPIWWLAIPAKLKSFIELVFQEGIVSDMTECGPKPLMKGKTAVVFQSYAMPAFAMKLFCGDIPMKYLKVILTNWCGIKIEKRFDLDMSCSASEKTKQKWLKEVKKFASKIK